ncbi:MAG: 50S ribosomal protein L9 [Thermodesulfovibrionales bacterium]
MKVILKEDVKNLGKMGSVVNVADGYARNFLIPRNLAVEANVKSVKTLEHEKRMIEEKAKKVKNSAQALAESLSKIVLTLSAKAGEEERLFGSITTMDIAEALKKEGIDIDKKKIILDEPIKRLGFYTVGIKIHPEITVSLNIKVVAE